jgi:GPN-loop GTPase
MAELGFGPNGGLIYCMEYLMGNVEWLEEELGDFDDDYLLIDCPGQIELYSHQTLMRRFVSLLRDQLNYRVCCVYMLDAHFVSEATKLMSGTLACLSAMMLLETPHVNVLTKVDLLSPKERALMKHRLAFDASLIADKLDDEMGAQFASLNHAFATLIDDYNLVGYVPLNINDDDTVSTLLQQIDNALQYGDDVEPKNFLQGEDDDDDAGGNGMSSSSSFGGDNGPAASIGSGAPPSFASSSSSM